ncbi:MAG: hypothetical protein WAK01_14680 [Methylocystis sp.]
MDAAPEAFLRLGFVRRFKQVLILAFGVMRAPPDRVILGTFAVAVFLVHYSARLLDPTEGGVLSSLHAAEVFGFAAMFFAVRDMGDRSSLRYLDLLLVAIAALALLRPWRSSGVLAFTLVGAGLLCRKDRNFAGFALLCLGLAWIDLWGQMVLRLIAPWLLPFETLLSFHLLSPFGAFSRMGTVISGAAGHSIAVYPGCSAFSNTLTATFIWLCLIQLAETTLHRWHLFALGAALACIVAINVARIGMMAYSEDAYIFWHLGGGATFISIAMLSCVVGFFLLAQLKLSGSRK